jgi:Flp pilus assembly pilin Flp
VLLEHAGLLAAGLVCGLVSAAVAIGPVVAGRWQDLPWRELAGAVAAVAAGGLLWTALATRWALRGSLLQALRKE